MLVHSPGSLLGFRTVRSDADGDPDLRNLEDALDEADVILLVLHVQDRYNGHLTARAI
jgi:hypothetical protein